MKTHIDFFETFKGEFIGGLKFKNRLIRLWGTETVDGIEVLKNRFMIYPNIKSSDNAVKTRVLRLCKMLGIKNQIESADFSPIAGYYLWFNPDKGTTQSDLIAEIIAEKIDEFCALNEWKYSTINYIDKSDPIKFDGWTKEQILNYIDNDYKKIFSLNNGFVAGETIEEELLGQYVLFDDDNEFEVQVLSTQITAIPYSNPNDDGYTSLKNRLRHTGLNVEIRFRRIVNDVSSTGSLVTNIMSEQEQYKLDLIREFQESVQGSETGIGKFGQKAPKTNEIWYKGQLRLSILKGGTGLRNKDVLDVVLSTLATGQIKKKVKWYKKILGFVLIVIAIVLAAPTGGASWSLATVALYVGVAVLVMTLIQVQWAKTNSAAAGYMGRWVRIANIISLVAGIGAVVQNAIKNLAVASAQQAGQQTAKQAAVAVAKESFATQLSMAADYLLTSIKEMTLSSVKDAVVNYFTNNFKSIGMKVAETAMNMRRQKMGADISSKQAQLRESEKAYAEINMDRNLNVGLEDLKMYPEQLQAIDSAYNYNDIYAPEPATIHVGNICKPNTYNAFTLNLRAEDLMKS